MLTADILHLTDAAKTLRFYRMSLSARALAQQDRNRDMAVLLEEAADAAGALADEYQQVALFRFCVGPVEAA